MSEDTATFLLNKIYKDSSSVLKSGVRQVKHSLESIFQKLVLLNDETYDINKKCNLVLVPAWDKEFGTRVNLPFTLLPNHITKLLILGDENNKNDSLVP
eukprot:Pgem_evm1s3651